MQKSIRTLYKEVSGLMSFSESQYAVSSTRCLHTNQRAIREAMEKDSSLRLEPVTFETASGEHVTVKALIQDAKPSKHPPIGTVVALHGSPGSSKDYKYVKPLLVEKGIRMIGINFPGYSFTEGHKRLIHNNTERNNYIRAVLKKANVSGKLVVMGHSRGGENAFAVAVENKADLSGLVLVNCTGLRINRGVRPAWFMKSVVWLYDLSPITAKLMNPVLKFAYNNVLGLRVDSGEMASLSVRNITNFDFDKALIPFIETLNKTNARVIHAYGGKDFLIETSIPKELAAKFDGHKEIICHGDDDHANNEVISKTKQMFQDGVRTVSVQFANDGHFIQKDRAKFIADGIEEMFKRH